MKSRREEVDPNDGFLRQLREFEERNMDFTSDDSRFMINTEVAVLVQRRHSIWC